MTRTELELQAAVEADADLRERLTEQFNLRGRSLGWFHRGHIVPEYREAAFEFAMGVHVGLQATGHPGFNGMELMVASVRGADFIFPIAFKEGDPEPDLDDEPQDDRCG